jgi:hypothetical protein
MLAELTMPRGTMRLTRSMTSGLTRAHGDPDGVFWGIGDRGPNLKPAAAVERYGLEVLAGHAATDGAKVMPLPAAGPALARFRVEGNQVHLESHAALWTPRGNPLSGLPLPLAEQEREPALALDGSALGCDPDGADTEGIAGRADGLFWIAEEYGPSLLLADRSGRIVRRHVPLGTAAAFAGSSVPVVETLPALALSRKLNRGFEGLALSPDGTVLYTAFQSPLSHPDRAAHEQSDVVRIWVLDAVAGAMIAEYAYPLDLPDSFKRDCTLGAVRRDDIKISELAMLADGSLLVLERVTASTRIHRVRPAPDNRLDRGWGDPARRPTLEQLGSSGLRAAGAALLDKQLVFSSDDHPEIGSDLEGMIMLAPDVMLLASDSDYGTEGAETGFWRVTFPAPL